ncbi:lipoate protein ligase C-terminal domain-containing protein [Pyrodictium abyssi]|uniref:lipoate--protein ligase n=1 Tax=Pyrodictium abyssi TaxID=54256 RepID=A0ABN6ZK29_9CREN|nr:hypothetical protein PABY_01800 [Pyrodictium abyssi]
MRSIHRVVRIPGGKTLEITMTVDKDCRIADISISGDFFVYPPEALEMLERELQGCSNTDCIASVVDLTSRGAEALGFSWEQLVETITRLYHTACSSIKHLDQP